ncbi:MAG TPA: M28 family peptidase [Gemmatimonadetes bacterium]|nr:M28 family peptidase [Gemmatimonadota bacterium]
MKRWPWLTTAATLAMASCQAGDSGGNGGVVRAVRPAFDANRAMRDLERQVEFGPRIPGTDGHAEQLEWLQTQLAALADTVFLDPFQHVTKEGDELKLTNVIARFGPSDGSRLLLLTHWDTRPKADQSFEEADRELPVNGANDGASGTAVLLELARMFSEQPPPGGVELLFSDGEDYGPSTEDMFLGARHYVAGIGSENPPAFGILLDMVGDADPNFPIESYSMEGASQVVQRVWGIAAELGYRRFFPMDAFVRVVDDHVQFIDAGIPVADIIDFDYGPSNGFWHTPRDVVENTSAQTLSMVGDVVAEVVYRNR